MLTREIGYYKCGYFRNSRHNILKYAQKYDVSVFYSRIIRQHVPSNYWYPYLASRLHGVTSQKTVM